MTVEEKIDTKRLFWGFEVDVPWNIPSWLSHEELNSKNQRIIAKEERHMTMLFLGSLKPATIQPIVDKWVEESSISSMLSPTGILTSFLTLPHNTERCLTLKGSFLTGKNEVDEMRSRLQNHFSSLLDEKEKGVRSRREFLPHITVARRPFILEDWSSQYPFFPLPFQVTHHSLFETIGPLKYRPIIRQSFFPGYEQFDHPADIGYTARGYSLRDLILHSVLAIARHEPQILQCIDIRDDQHQLKSPFQITEWLNSLIAEIDSIQGSRIKAISYHALSETIRHVTPDSLSKPYYEWEFIIDV